MILAALLSQLQVPSRHNKIIVSHRLKISWTSSMLPEDSHNRHATHMDSNPYSPPAETADNPIRIFRSIWIVAVLLLAVMVLFASLPLMLTLITLLACNGIAFFVLLIVHRTTEASLAFLSALLMLATLMFTNWGFSMPNPRIRVSWISLIPACISQLTLISMPVFWSLRNSRIRNDGGSACK